MSTFLAICQEVSDIVGLQGTIQSVSTVSGYQSTLVQYVKNAYEDIQSYRDEWRFLRTFVNINLTAGDTSYTPISNIEKWDMTHIYYDNSPLTIVSYDYYIESEQLTASQSSPSLVAQDYSNKNLHFNPADSSYTITAYYWSIPETLSNNTDIPSIPVEYHKLIIYRAATDFAAFIGNGNLYQAYNAKASTLTGKLLRNYNPGKRILPRPAC